MTHSNIPTMLQREDFQARHSDMLAAARCEPLTSTQVEAKRKINPYVYDKATRSLLPNAEAQAEIWQALRERLEQCEVQGFIGIDMAKPGSDRTVIVRTKLPMADLLRLNECVWDPWECP